MCGAESGYVFSELGAPAALMAHARLALTVVRAALSWVLFGTCSDDLRNNNVIIARADGVSHRCCGLLRVGKAT